MKVTVITPTGNRPEAFALCREYMKRQTIQPDQWIVVDDGDEPMQNPDGFKYLRREGGEDEHTLRFNLLEALPKVTGDLVLIMEDDDWYDPTYIAYMRSKYRRGTIYGQSSAIYYDVQRRWYLAREFPANMCLCQLGFCSSLIPFVKSCCQEPGFMIDVRLCQHPNARFLKGDDLFCIGIKCLPGRKGLSLGWKLKEHYPDSNMMALKEWIGMDYKNYERFYDEESRIVK